MNILTKIFVEIDDFVKEYGEEIKKRLISDGISKRVRESKLSMSEIMTIIVYFHIAKFRTFKDYYLKYVSKYLKQVFPDLVSYKRFVNLKPKALLYLTVYMRFKRTKQCSGISFIDSTTIKVCHNKRISSHKVFKGLAKRGKTSMGWFYGFKLHLVVNDKGEIINFVFTPGNVDDRDKEKVINKITKGLFGKLFGDKGYLSKSLFNELYSNGIELITKIKKNMKNKLLPLIDKLLLRKRAIIETINDQLKNISQLEHTRHRSPINAMVNWISALIAYSYQPKKPSLNLSSYEKKVLDGNLLGA